MKELGVTGMFRLLAIVLFISLLFPHGIAPAAPQVVSAPFVEQTREARVEQLMAQMTLRQKVGQMFMITIYSPFLLDTNAQFIRDYAPGAVALFKSNLDYQPAHQVAYLINSIQTTSVEASDIPMLVAVDQEGGRVLRLINGFTQLPAPLFIGAAQDPALAFQLGQAIAHEMRGVGVNMNLAPVVDLFTREDELNTLRVLNQRTLGQDPYQVGQISAALVQGMASEHVIGVLKHFPGHSPTITDSHRDIAIVDIDRATFEATNLQAFKGGIEAGADVVMIGHLYYPALEPVENLPASLSPTMVALLRNDLNFQGVIMTDALDMGAILNYHSAEEAAMMAVQAGVDLLAFGPNMSFSNQKAMLERVYQAFESGELPVERLDESVRRILLLKAKYNLLDWSAMPPEEASARIQKDKTSETLTKVFEGVITVAYDPQKLLPLDAEKSITVIYPIGQSTILEECSIYLPNAEFFGFSFNPADWEYGAAVQRSQKADIIIAFGLNLNTNDGQARLIGRLPPDKTIFVSLGTPYDWEFLEQPTAGYVLAYANMPESQTAACRVLAGIAPAQGILPVQVSEFAIGTGIHYKQR